MTSEFHGCPGYDPGDQDDNRQEEDANTLSATLGNVVPSAAAERKECEPQRACV